MKIQRGLFFGCMLLIIGLLTTTGYGRQSEKSEGIRVAYGVICTDVQNREPIGIDSTFSAAVGSLYCFTRIEGAADTTSVTHVWYFGEKKMSEITLAVKSPSWRTQSNKKILPNWTGKWNVVVLSERGDPLTQISFNIKGSKSE